MKTTYLIYLCLCYYYYIFFIWDVSLAFSSFWHFMATLVQIGWAPDTVRTTIVSNKLLKILKLSSETTKFGLLAKNWSNYICKTLYNSQRSLGLEVGHFPRRTRPKGTIPDIAMLFAFQPLNELFLSRSRELDFRSFFAWCVSTMRIR